MFGSLALVMVGVRRTSDRRDRYLHHGSWLIKAGLWIVCMVFPFFLPNGAVNAYGMPGCGFSVGSVKVVYRAYCYEVCLSSKPSKHHPS